MKITQHSPTVTIIEQDACRRSILFEDKRYFLSMPPIIFFIKHTKSFKINLAYGFFNIDKKLYDLPFYNIFFDGKICMGKTKRKFDSLEDLVDGFLKSFWSSKFTDEASASVGRYMKRMILRNMKQF
ncbi:MAG: hypothetical protein EKK64_06880 [Neisseriaceae bacterium]|nr:MAG: hypothetical protein EKK64_06880 [Neisseriaceae bacterium]